MTLHPHGFVPLLQVFDMPASLAFYRDLLGFATVTDVPPDGRCDWVRLRCGDSELMLNTAYEAAARPPVPDPTRMAVHADTILYFNCDDVDGACATLRARGVAAEQPVETHYGMTQVYLTDPDGYEICLQQPTRS